MTVPIEHIELNKKVYEALKQMILNRQFAGGEKLDINELAKQMQVSRTPLKEAVNKLLENGLVEIRPRVGTYITRIGRANITETMDMRLMVENWCFLKLSRSQALQIYEGMQKIIDDTKLVFQSPQFDYYKFVELDIAFHDLIVDSFPNKLMENFYHSLNCHLQIARVYNFRSHDRAKAGLEEHESIAQAVGDYDLMGASALLAQHIETSKQKMLEIMDQNGEDYL